MRLSRRRGQVTHVLLTRSPLIQDPQKQAPSPFDLHVLSTPPAFVLSQDQTLQTKPTKTPTNPTQQARNQPEQQSEKAQKTRPHGPTQPPQQKPGKPKQNKPQKTTQNAQPPRTHGIKNMTHYRVLKQHTQPDLTEALRLQLVLASNSATVEDLPFQRQVEDLCPRSHLLAILCCGSPPRGSRRRLGPFGSGLYFRQSHPLDVKPDTHDPGHTDFSLIFQRFRRYARNAVATTLP